MFYRDDLYINIGNKYPLPIIFAKLNQTDINPNDKIIVAVKEKQDEGFLNNIANVKGKSVTVGDENYYQISESFITDGSYFAIQFYGFEYYSENDKILYNDLLFIFVRDNKGYELIEYLTDDRVIRDTNETYLNDVVINGYINNELNTSPYDSIYKEENGFFHMKFKNEENKKWNFEITEQYDIYSRMKKVKSIETPIIYKTKQNTLEGNIEGNIEGTEIISFENKISYIENVKDKWFEFDTGKFSNQVSFYSKVFMNETNIIEDEDLIAAFVKDASGNEELRGVTNVVVDDVCKTVICIDELNHNETIKFKLYKSKNYVINDEVLLQGNCIYELSDVLPVGSIIEGGIYSTEYDDAFKFKLGRMRIELTSSNNEFSMNININNPVKETIFGENLNKIKGFRNQKYIAIKSGDKWLSSTIPANDPDLPKYGTTNFAEANFITSTFYSVEIEETVLLEIDGNPIGTPTNISLKKGYNWVGYPIGSEKPISEVLGGNQVVNSNDEKTLNSVYTKEHGASIYNTSADSFIGTLSTMKPGGSYMINVKENSKLTLNKIYNMENEIISPAGFFEITFTNPFEFEISNTYVYINNGELAFIFEKDGKCYGFIHENSYIGLGQHNTSFQTNNLKIDNIIIPNVLNGSYIQTKLEVEFTISDNQTCEIDKTNGNLDFMIIMEPDPLNSDGESATNYKLSELGEFLSETKKPPFSFEGTFKSQSEVPIQIQNFVFGKIPSISTETTTFTLLKQNTGSKQIEVLFSPDTLINGDGLISAIQLNFNEDIELVSIVKDYTNELNVWVNVMDAVGPNAVGLISMNGIPIETFGSEFKFKMQYKSVDLDKVNLESVIVADSSGKKYKTTFK
tara:strand:+ start:139 stop:2709 length:2571 start_codon:yes stop_codon:yes gene_type:complete